LGVIILRKRSDSIKAWNPENLIQRMMKEEEDRSMISDNVVKWSLHNNRMVQLDKRIQPAGQVLEQTPTIMQTGIP